jgi:hypothetical protein
MRDARGTVCITQIGRGGARVEGDAGTEFGELVGLVVARVVGVAGDLLERDGAALELRKLVEDFVPKQR